MDAFTEYDGEVAKRSVRSFMEEREKGGTHKRQRGMMVGRKIGGKWKFSEARRRKNAARYTGRSTRS